MSTETQTDPRIRAASDALFDYACDRLTARQAKRKLEALGYLADLRQFIGHALEVTDAETGHCVWLEA